MFSLAVTILQGLALAVLPATLIFVGDDLSAVRSCAQMRSHLSDLLHGRWGTVVDMGGWDQFVRSSS